MLAGSAKSNVECANEKKEPREEQKARKTSRESVDFKIAQDETWLCDRHKLSKIFYCLEHSVPFCPNCLKEHHKDCFNKDAVLDASNVAERLRERCQELGAAAESKLKETEVLRGRYEQVSAAAAQNKDKHDQLYKLIQTHMAALTESSRTAKAEEDEKLIAVGKDILGAIGSASEEYSNLIKGYKTISDRVEQPPDKEPSIKDLIASYQSLEPAKSVHQEQKGVVEKRIDEFMQKIKASSIGYSELSVKERLSATFSKIHNKGVMEASEQGTADFVFSAAPLSPLLCIYDLHTCVVTRKTLSLGGKRYRLPYGTGMVQLAGKILITGGTQDLSRHLRDCLEYSMMKDVLVPRAEMCCERSEHGVATVGGEVWCVGGRNDRGYLATCERSSGGTTRTWRRKVQDGSWWRTHRITRWTRTRWAAYRHT